MITKITVNNNDKHQTFETFGASGAWWAQVVGKLDIADDIAKLLYSKEDGIGLNVYRYNLGAGTMKDGESPYCVWERATEKVKTDKYAVEMMQKCVDAGADEITVFVNSPPVELTVNGKGRCERALAKNIKPSNYKAFADYCLDSCEYLLDKGLPVKYLSPVNEPVWIWSNDKQEGCHYMPRDVQKLFEVFTRELDGRSTLKDKLLLAGTECADLRWFNKSYSRAVLNNVFVKKYIDSIDYHSYWLNSVKPFFSDRIAYLKRYRKFHDKYYPNTKIKMTEWCHMQGGTDCSMKSGIVTANTIYKDIKYADVVSWQHWVAVAFGGYCDGIIYVDKEKQTYELTKRYYVTGNFSKFITGATRYDAECDNKNINCLYFEKNSQNIFILINNSNQSQTVKLPILTAESLIYITDDTHNLSKHLISTKEITLTPQSVNTVITGK
ncbi:MAG: hypothetical protein LIO62_06565 [Clostridiales bacterium]|nr:hypothetical protein [Clostridiales bacterium]